MLKSFFDYNKQRVIFPEDKNAYKDLTWKPKNVDITVAATTITPVNKFERENVDSDRVLKNNLYEHLNDVEKWFESKTKPRLSKHII